MNENAISHVVIGAAIEVHRELGGPGLLESAYEEAMAFELCQRGMVVVQQIDVPIIYKGHRLQKVYRLDLLVNDLVIVEIKAVDQLHPVHFSQCLTQLRVTGLKLALLINFGERFVKDGVHRVVNNL